MNKLKKYSWLALGLSGVILAIVSIRFSQPTPSELKPETEEEVEVVETHEEEPMGMAQKGGAIQVPTSRNMPSIEIHRPRDTREADLPREFKPSEEAKNLGAEPPPITLGEPGFIEPGRRRAWNDWEENIKPLGDPSGPSYGGEPEPAVRDPESVSGPVDLMGPQDSEPDPEPETPLVEPPNFGSEEPIIND